MGTHVVLKVERQRPGGRYTLEAVVRDEQANTLTFVAAFCGHNPSVSRLVVNEFIGRGSTIHPDRVEIKALTDGNMGGVVLYLVSAPLIPIPALSGLPTARICAQASTRALPFSAAARILMPQQRHLGCRHPGKPDTYPSSELPNTVHRAGYSPTPRSHARDRRAVDYRSVIAFTSPAFSRAGRLSSVSG